MYRAQLKQELKEALNISLTTDIWKNSRSVYFIAITGHYFNKYQLISKVLSFRRVVGRETALIIRKYITNECKKLNIVGKIVGITTDSGSSIKAACEGLGFGMRLSCVAHDLNLIVSNGLNLWKNAQIAGDDENLEQSNEDIEIVDELDDDSNDQVEEVEDEESATGNSIGEINNDDDDGDVENDSDDDGDFDNDSDDDDDDDAGDDVVDDDTDEINLRTLSTCKKISKKSKIM